MEKIFTITPNTKVYIFCPSQFSTGGPEAVHQLSDALITLGIDCSIIYTLSDHSFEKEGKHPSLSNYKSKSTTVIDDEEENILIIPEHYLTKNFMNLREVYTNQLKHI